MNDGNEKQDSAWHQESDGGIAVRCVTLRIEDWKAAALHTIGKDSHMAMEGMLLEMCETMIMCNRGMVEEEYERTKDPALGEAMRWIRNRLAEIEKAQWQHYRMMTERSMAEKNPKQEGPE